MSILARFFGWFYALCLNLYPKEFRAEFSDEMYSVFMQVIQDHNRISKLLKFFLREFRGLIVSLAREHASALTGKELSMATIYRKPEWSFYPTWIILTALCIPIAFILDLFILKVITKFVGDFIYVNGVRHITEDYLFMYPFIPIAGLLTGLLQYGLLRRYLPRMGWWVLATTAGWLLGVFLIVISGWLNFWTYESFEIDVAFIVLGLSIGVGQWLLLRQRLPRAAWWVVANVVGWGLLGLITGNTLDQFGLLALGFVPTCVTAVILGLLLNLAHPAEM